MNRNQITKTMSTVIRPAVMLVIALGLTVGDAAAAAAQLQKYAEAWPEKGELTIMRKGRAYDFQAGRGKIALAMGDVIRTHKDSKVKVILEDENTVVLGSNAVMEIKPWQRGKTRGFLKGLVGSFIAMTSKVKKAPLYMQTTNATCGIRGSTASLTVTMDLTNMLNLEGDMGIMPIYVSDVAGLTTGLSFNTIAPGMQGLTLGSGNGSVFMSQAPPNISDLIAGTAGGAEPGVGGSAGAGGGPGGGAGAGGGPGGTGGGPGGGASVVNAGALGGLGAAGAGLGELIISGTVNLDSQLNLDVDLSTLSTGDITLQNLGLGSTPLPAFDVNSSEATVVASVSTVVAEPVVTPPSGPSGGPPVLIPESDDQFTTDSPNIITVPPGGSLPDVIQQNVGPLGLQPQPGQTPGGATPGGGQTGPGSTPETGIVPIVPQVIFPKIDLDNIQKTTTEQAKEKARLNIKFEK